MTEKPLRVGVVGVGYLGSIHARIYHKMANVDLVAVTDTNAEQGGQVARECDCSFLQDLDSLLDSVDAVSIVVPTSLHREIAEPFLDKGIPVLLEKPVAHTLEDARAIVNLAKQTGTLLQIGHLERFNARGGSAC